MNIFHLTAPAYGVCDQISPVLKFIRLKLFLFTGLLCIYAEYPLSAQLNWVHTNGPEGAYANQIWYNDQYAFHADEYAIFRTPDGQNWERLPIGALGFLGVSNSKVTALINYGVFNTTDNLGFLVSDDNGVTWKEGTLPPTSYNGLFSDIAVCSHGIYVPDGEMGVVFRSQDDGLTWDVVAPPGQFAYDIWAFEDKIYLGWYNKFWRLNESTDDWEQISPEFAPGFSPYTMFISGNIQMYASTDTILSTDDNGATWVKTPIPFSNNNADFLQLGNRIFKSISQAKILMSEDGGHNWNSLPTPVVNAVFRLGTAGGKLLCSVNTKGVLAFDEMADTLVQANTGLTSAVINQLVSNQEYLWASFGNGIARYNLADEVWQSAPLPLPYISYRVIRTNENGKVATCAETGDIIYVSHDNGNTWNRIDLSEEVGINLVRISIMAWLGDILYVYGMNGEILRSSDGGLNWEITSIPANVVKFKGKHYGIAGFGVLKTSSDNGLNWEIVSTPLTPISRLYASDDKLMVLVRDELQHSTVYVSEDLINWKYANDGIPDILNWAPIGTKDYGKFWHKGTQYYFFEEKIGLFASLDSCQTWIPIEKDDAMEIAGTLLFKGGHGGGVFKVGLPNDFDLKASGVVFKDDNNNGVKDAGEIPLPGVKVAAAGNKLWPFWFTTTKQNGSYSLFSTTGNADTLKVNIKTPYQYQINPPYYTLNGSGSGYNFGIHLPEAVTDVMVTGDFNRRPRRGAALRISISLENIGTVPASGSLGLKLNQHFEFDNAMPQPDAIIGGDSLVWYFSHPGLFEKSYINVTGNIPPTAPLGDAVKINGRVLTTESDFDLSNNSLLICDTIVGSYDPNEKRVEPITGLTSAEIVSGKELTYTILFQNTGTFQADRVRITDHLDTALNLETIRLISASHPVTQFNLQPGGLLEVIFENIALPDSNSNEPASHGFLKFAIQRKKQYHPNFRITNKAAIFFDFNNPIITNTVETKLYTPVVSIEEPHNALQQPQLLISPNPTSVFCRVSSDELMSGPVEILVTDMSGKVCLRQFANDINKGVTLSVANLSNGSYTIMAVSQSGSLSGKLLVAHKK